MHPRPSHLLTVLSLGAVVACGPRDETGMATDTAQPAASESPTARVTNVRIVHAMPGVTGIDLIADDRPEVSNVAFRSVSPYEQVSNEVRMFRVVRAGQTGTADSVTLVRSNELALTGQYHTLIAFGAPGEDHDRVARPRDTGLGADTAVAARTDTDAQLAHVRDDEPLNDSTMARLRVVNAAANTEDLDFVMTGRAEPVFDGIDYGVQVHSAEVPAGNVTIQVRREGRNAPLTRVENLRLEAGTTTTLILTHPSPTSDRIEVIRVTDGRSGAASPAETRGRDTTGTSRPPGSKSPRDTSRQGG